MRKAILILVAVLAVVAAFLLIRSCADDAGGYEVRAVFDNGSFVVPGEDVRVAGANVGSVASIDVSMPGEVVSTDPDDPTRPGKAIVVMKITDKGFQDFREDASCLIRPQSLIGEKFVDCSVTDPRAPGTEAPPVLPAIPDGEPGAGQHLLPLENNGKSVDQDLINNIYRLPYAQRFRIILNELGAGLATRGPELNETITRANPTLMQVNKVLKTLASQNDKLAQLAVDGDKNMTALAAKRRNMTGFFRSAGFTAAATAERGEDLKANLQKLPQTLRELRLTFNSLGNFAGKAQPVFDSLRPNVDEISEVTTKLGPFADATQVSLRSLGRATRTAGPDLVASRPIIQKLGRLARKSETPATDLNFLLASTRQAGGFENLMKLFYNTANTVNGYDQYGHYQRTNVLVSGCVEYKSLSFTGCETNWTLKDMATKSSALLPQLGELDDGALSGPTGVTGPTGGTGPTGETGPTGVTGATDDTLIPDASGPTGPTDAGSADDQGAGTAADSGDVPSTKPASSTSDSAPRSLRRDRGGDRTSSQMIILDYLLGQ